MKAFSAELGCNFAELLSKNLPEPGPCLINVPIGLEEELYPMVPPGASDSITLGALIKGQQSSWSYVPHMWFFSRRAYNLEAIVCVPTGTGEVSWMWLKVNQELKLEKWIK